MAPAPKHSPEEQEQMIINAAIKCIEQTSLMDFTMSAISKEAGLSMGSIYKFIQSKEDVLVVLSTVALEALDKAFSELLSLPLSTPERLMAIHLFDHSRTAPFCFSEHLQMLVGNESVLERASKKHLETMIEVDMRIEELFKRVLNEACDTQELHVSDEDRDTAIEEIIVGHWSLCIGFSQVAMQRDTRNLAGFEHEMPFPLNENSAVIQNSMRLMNTYPWQRKLTQDDLINICNILKAKGML